MRENIFLRACPITLSLILLSANIAYPLDRKLIRVEALPGEDEYLATGLVPFPPDVIVSTSNLRILNALSNSEVPSFIIEEEKWPDGSLMLVEIGFVVKTHGWQTQQYWLEWGKEISRGDISPEDKLDPLRKTALATTSFRVVEGLPDEAEDIIKVGTMMIRVEEHSGIIYYWYLAPVIGLLSIVIWRKFHLA